MQNLKSTGARNRRNRTFRFFHSFLMIMIFQGCFILPGNNVRAQSSPVKMKIGVYDSRILTLAWSRSAFFSDHQKIFGLKSDSATRANDTVRLKELSIEALSYQHLLHLMVFGSGSVSEIIGLVKDDLKKIAAGSGVGIVVSKYELNYADPSVEVTDLTDMIVQLFKPDENLDKMIGEMRKVEPVPLGELTIEAELLDLYCTKFK
jgi:hypothetical protein